MSSILGRFLNYLLVSIYTRIFIPAEYGIITELYAYVSFLNIILTYGMETGYFRFYENQTNGKKVYTTTLTSLFATSSLFVFLIAFFAQPIANLLDYADQKEYIIWFAFIIGLDAITAIPFAKLRQQNKALKFALLKFAGIGLTIAFNLFFLVFCPYLLKRNPASFINYFYSIEIGVGYVFLANLIASAFTFLFLLPEIFEFKFDFDFKLLKKMLIYSLPLLVAGLAGMVNETLDRLLLKEYLPKSFNAMAQIGIYGANYKIAILMTLFIQMFRYAAEPFFFAQAKESKSRVVYADVMKYFIIFGLIIFLGVMLYIDIIKYFIGSNYWIGLKIVPIILMANLFLGIFFNLSIWYKLTNQTKFGAYLAIFGAIITVIFNILLIPEIGYLGSAWATFICYFLMMIASYFLGQKYFYVKYDLKRIFEYIGLALAIYFCSTFISSKSLILTIIINTVLFSIFMYFVFEKEKLKRYFSFLKNKN